MKITTELGWPEIRRDWQEMSREGLSKKWSGEGVKKNVSIGAGSPIKAIKSTGFWSTFSTPSAFRPEKAGGSSSRELPSRLREYKNSYIWNRSGASEYSHSSAQPDSSRELPGAG